MADGYEVEGRLEGNTVIRLDTPIPWKEGRVRVVVNPLDDTPDRSHQNRPALQALHQLLQQPDDLTVDQWEELERIIEEHSVRIRRDALG